MLDKSDQLAITKLTLDYLAQLQTSNSTTPLAGEAITAILRQTGKDRHHVTFVELFDVVYSEIEKKINA
nr:hypothetical protein [uncultured Tolumonas sp.]